MTTPATRLHAAQASDRLTTALVDAASRGDKIPCGDYSVAYLFLSEDQADRQIAMRLCRPCVVKTECLEAAIANNEVFTVRGGHDFTRTPGRPKTAA